MKAWHFVGDRLRDGRPVPADGVMLKHSGPLVMCESGLHASLHPFDALQYAPGSTLCLVECGEGCGPIKHESDKLVCSKRTIVTRMDAEPLLRYFARQQALSVVHLWDAPQVVLDFLAGDDAARDAARTAAWAAARDAAWDAAWGVATWAAAWAAAPGSVWAAAWAAARDATLVTPWAAARADFATLVNDAFEDWL